MILEEIRLGSFKGFRDFHLRFSQVTCLVGPNNGGKTSVLQAIQLLCDIFRFAFGNRDEPDFTNVRWQANPAQMLQRLSFGDLEAVWLQKRTAESCSIKVSFSDDVALALTIRGPSSYMFDVLIGGESISGQALKSEHYPIVQNLWHLAPTYVPPVGAIAPAERFQAYPDMEQQLNKGRSSECWRSQLYWLRNDGEKDDFDRIIARVQQYLPGVTVLPPRLTRAGNPPDVLVQYVEADTTLDISTSGGGLRTLLNLAVVLEFLPSRCLLLDEPDAHLHSTLQRAVGQMLADFSQEHNTQLVIATHAPDLIGEFPVESLAWIDRTQTEAGRTNNLGRFLADLGALSKADAIRAHGADKVLFVEGSLDRSLLNHLFALSGNRSPFDDSQVIVSTLPSGRGNAVHLGMFQRLLEEALRLQVNVACILDADYELQSDIETRNDRVLVVTLGRKEVENYLITPDVLARACESIADKRCEKTGQKLAVPASHDLTCQLDLILSDAQIRDAVRWQVVPRFRDTLGKNLDTSTREEKADRWFDDRWGDREWRMNHCPGKKVLAELRRWVQANYGITLTAGELRRAITVCPPDIEEVASQIEKHFYGEANKR